MFWNQDKTGGKQPSGKYKMWISPHTPGMWEYEER